MLTQPAYYALAPVRMVVERRGFAPQHMGRHGVVVVVGAEGVCWGRGGESWSGVGRA